ncbi:MAG: A24 family peptidase [Candidatus Ruminococcus intestinipullorum]|nr:A24 family peptidase [Candidatus Ruminococcus intestinipullorum]
MCEISRVCFACYLCAVSVWDIQKRWLPLWLIGIGGGLAVLFSILEGNLFTVWVILGMVFGICFLGVSRITREALGYGDSLMILILGIYLGIWKVMPLLAIAYTLAAIFGGILLLKKGFHKKESMPFIPFLAISYLGILIMGGI